MELDVVEAYEMALEQAGRGHTGPFPCGVEGAYELSPPLRVTRVAFDGVTTSAWLDQPPRACAGDPVGLRHGARGDVGVWRQWRPFREADASVVNAGKGRFGVAGDARGVILPVPSNRPNHLPCHP